MVAIMVEQAEDNLELDFTSIFRLCLRDDDDHLVQLGVEGLWELGGPLASGGARRIAAF